MKTIIQINTGGQNLYYVKARAEGITLIKSIDKAKDYFDSEDKESDILFAQNYYGEEAVEVLDLNAGKLRTDEGVSIEERIKKGKTFVSRIRGKAQEVADQRRTYVYDLFLKGKFWGYGVPS